MKQFQGMGKEVEILSLSTFLRACNLGEKALKLHQSQAPTADHSPLLFDGTCRASGVNLGVRVELLPVTLLE
jgi:hypothetical protein